MPFFSEQDFYNLVDVYLDAVFFPKCVEDFQTFQQEGWHYELALNKVKASMTEEDLAELARATHELRLKQETPDPPEALKAVPSLSLSDIPRKPIFVPTEVIIVLFPCS